MRGPDGSSRRRKRARLGLLEKKKDYVLRARDFHRKEKTLTALEERASARNPDEFYFAMQNQRTERGVHVARASEANKYTQEQLRIMKTQDSLFLAMRAQIDRKKGERLRATLHGTGLPAPNRHTIFVEDAGELTGFDAAAHFDTAPELVPHKANRLRTAQLPEGGRVPKASRRVERRTDAAYREMELRLDRSERLQGMVAKMDAEKLGMGKGRKRKVGVRRTAAGNVPVYKFKRERKR